MLQAADSMCYLNIKNYDKNIYEKYKIHDNGSRPFKVLVGGNKVHIFKKGSPECFLEFSPEQVFIDSDPSYKEQDIGSAILLKTGPLQYMFIGAQIASFTSYAEITKFVCKIGNNDVPYAYAFDVDSNAYLFAEDAVLRNVPTYHDPYNIYYLKCRITPLPCYSKDFVPIFQNILKFYINGSEYSLSFQLKAADNYNRLKECFAEEDGAEFDLSILLGSEDSPMTLTFDDYVKIMDDYAQEIGCVEFLNIEYMH
jgi:hypothetical protein